VNQAGFSADKTPMYQVVTDATGITTITDKRASTAYLGRSVVNVAGNADVVLTRDQLDAPIIELQGLLTGNISVIFPAVKRAWIVYNNSTGAFSLTAKVAAQAGVSVPSGRRAVVYGDGTDIRGASGIPGTSSEFPSGTALVFQQTAAPTGWTKSVTHNDKALRVVSGAVGSGGASAFSSVFGAGKSAGNYAGERRPHHGFAGVVVPRRGARLLDTNQAQIAVNAASRRATSDR
jgi:hypothetical protein